jgi:hypothetical protein
MSPVKVDVRDVLERANLHNLALLDTSLRRVGKELHGPCPFCTCSSTARRHQCDRFRLDAERKHWYCRHCAANGGNAIDYVMRRYQVAFKQACYIALGGQRPTLSPHVKQRTSTAPAMPSKAWQQRGLQRGRALPSQLDPAPRFLVGEIALPPPRFDLALPPPHHAAGQPDDAAVLGVDGECRMDEEAHVGAVADGAEPFHTAGMGLIVDLAQSPAAVASISAAVTCRELRRRDSRTSPAWPSPSRLRQTVRRARRRCNRSAAPFGGADRRNTPDL